MALQPAYHESLPYADTDPTPDALAAAHALIAAETSSSSSTQPQKIDHLASLPPIQPPNFSPLIAAELERVASSKPLPSLDLSRYEAQEPLPPPDAAAADGSTNEEAKRLLGNAYVSATYLDARNTALKLLEAHGPRAWLLGNHYLEAELRHFEDELAATKAQINELNGHRRDVQVENRAEMLTLEGNWKAGVARVLETELAVEEMRSKIREVMREKASQA